MSTSVAVVITVLIAALGVAFVIGRLLTLRAGMLKETHDAEVDTTDLGLSHTGPTVVHFSAVWCGPCAGVRRVVNQVCADLPGGRARRDRHGRQSRGGAAAFGAVAADDVHLRRSTVASDTAPRASPRPLTCGRRWNRCWLDHPVIG